MTDVIFSDRDIVKLESLDYQQLIKMALESDKKRARICLHKDHSSPIQEMVIALCKGTVIGQHRQKFDAGKSYVMISGYMDVLFYEESGEVIETVRMGGYSSDGVFSLRFPSNSWIDVIPVSDLVVYSEFIKGPYRAEDTEWR